MGTNPFLIELIWKVDEIKYLDVLVCSQPPYNVIMTLKKGKGKSHRTLRLLAGLVVRLGLIMDILSLIYICDILIGISRKQLETYIGAQIEVTIIGSFETVTMGDSMGTPNGQCCLPCLLPVSCTSLRFRKWRTFPRQDDTDTSLSICFQEQLLLLSFPGRVRDWYWIQSRFFHFGVWNKRLGEQKYLLEQLLGGRNCFSNID